MSVVTVTGGLRYKSHKPRVIRAHATTHMETMTLAPAAGAGIGKIIADRLLAEPGFVDAMISAIMGGLQATRSFWAKDPDDPDAKAKLRTEPDSKIQLQAFSLVLAHMEGEPIKRVIHQHLGASGEINLQAAVAESPQLQEQLARLLENATWKQSGRKRTKQAEPAKFDPPEMG